MRGRGLVYEAGGGVDDRAALILNLHEGSGARPFLSLVLLPHLDGEAVAAARDGLDERAAAERLAERLAQREDVLRARRAGRSTLLRTKGSAGPRSRVRGRPRC